MQANNITSEHIGEEQREEQERRAEKKRHNTYYTTLTKVVSSLSPSPTHQGLQHWRRAMQPVVVGNWRDGDRGRGSRRRLRWIRSFSYFRTTEGKLSKYVCSIHGTASSQGTVGPVIERMDASINTAENDFPVPQRTGDSCNVRMRISIKYPSIHISDFRTGMCSPPCF